MLSIARPERPLCGGPGKSRPPVERDRSHQPLSEGSGGYRGNPIPIGGEPIGGANKGQIWRVNAAARVIQRLCGVPAPIAVDEMLYYNISP